MSNPFQYQNKVVMLEQSDGRVICRIAHDHSSINGLLLVDDLFRESGSNNNGSYVIHPHKIFKMLPLEVARCKTFYEFMDKFPELAI